jgi:hypothetical protein
VAEGALVSSVMKSTIGSIAPCVRHGNSKTSRARHERERRLQSEVYHMDRALVFTVGAPVEERKREPWTGPPTTRPEGYLHLSTSYKPAREKCIGEAYIYGLADPRDHIIRYVGKTQNELDYRLWQHEFSPSNGSVCSWLRGLRKAGLSAEVVVLEICLKYRWKKREEHWIAALSAGAKLFNRTPGGRFDNPSRRTAARVKAENLLRKVTNCGPVRALSRDEIASIYGESAVPNV